jgi:hypothetical protein
MDMRITVLENTKVLISLTSFLNLQNTLLKRISFQYIFILLCLLKIKYIILLSFNTNLKMTS